MIDPEDLELFERSVRNATVETTGAALDAALDDLGWHDALTADPRAAISLLFELQGASNAHSSALGHVVARALGVAPGAGIVLPAVGGCDPPGTAAGPTIHLHGVAHDGLVEQQSALVVTSVGERLQLITVPASPLGMRPIQGIDPRLSLVEVTGDVGRAEDGVDLPAAVWADAMALGRLAVAHELVGASRAMLGLACEHARGRIQFGRPIASFQAVRHRLAETRVGVDMAEAMLDAAWLDRSPGTAAMAKAVAGRQARTAARHCQQVLAGIGFTIEHPLHGYVRRTLVLDALLGTAASLTGALGRGLLDQRRLPPPLPL